MRIRRGRVVAALCLVLLAALLLAPSPAFARAGGGGGKGGGAVSVVLLPFFAAYSALMTYLVARKSRQCRQMLERLARQDPSWDEEAIQQRVRETSFKVQEAWMQRNQDIAKDYMSPALYHLHKLQTDQMLRQGRRNMLERINLKEAQIIGVKDFRDDSKDRLTVHIEGSMIDYMVEDVHGRQVSGNRLQPESFKEIWTFVRGEAGWVLHEIDQKASIGDVTGTEVSSEGGSAV